MPVKVRCPGCEKVLNAPDSARGKAIRCPACEAKIPVPKAAAKPAKKVARNDSESSLMTLDLSRAEATDVKVCRRCGAEMPEEATECPECGLDQVTGGMGEQARKRSLRGPDPDDFYKGLWKDGWKFVGKNQGLAWRSILYTVICSVLCFGAAFMYLWVYTTPPRVFWALIVVVSAMVIPGWYWFLDTTVIAATLEKKDKLKRVNFDFFLSSSLGLKAVGWLAVFALPIMLPAIAFIYFVILPMDLPPYVVMLVGGACALPLLTMLPTVMAHMTMPVTAPGWMFWKVIPAWARTLKASLAWTGLVLATCLPSLVCVVLIAALSAESLANFYNTMESNAKINYAKYAEALKGTKKSDKPTDAEKAQEELAKGTPAAVDYYVLILPASLWIGAVTLLGFPALFNMRTNGQFTYYNKPRLDLVGRAKDYKYVAKERTEEGEEEEEKAQNPFVNGVVGALIASLVGGIGGMVYASASGGPTMTYAMAGAALVNGLSMGGASLSLLIAAFRTSAVMGILCLFLGLIGQIIFAVQHWDEAKGPFILEICCLVGYMAFGIAYIMMAVQAAVPVAPAAAGG